MKKTVFLRKMAAVAMAVLLLMSQPLALAAYKTLEYGSRGSSVLELQKALLSLGFDPNGTDGKYGSGTRNAVKAYQKSRGLTADGKAGNITLSLLYSEVNGSSGSGGSSDSASSDEATSTNPNTLKYGSTGSRVSDLQTNLKKLGYYTGSVDGKFGAGTKRAVIAFQSANNLTPDGLAGTQTLTLLGALASNAGSGSSSSSSSSSSSGSSSSTSTSGLTRTLRRGYTGDDVVKVQNRLKELGYYSKTIDGVYGLGSMAAVKAFQERNGLNADGLAGTQTFNVLFSSSAIAAGSNSSSSSSSGSGSSDGSSSSSSSTSYPRLAEGAEGEDVRTMQRALQNLNYPLTVDGSFGPTTKAAVKLFQGANGLSADGIAGQATLSLLYSGNAKAYSGSTSSGSSSSSGGTVSSSAGASSMGSFTGRNGATIQLLHWFNEVKTSLKTGQNLQIYDPETGISFTLYVMSRGRHADVEPLTADDTEKMMRAWGGEEDWTPKAVYVKLPDGRWTVATMHNVAHGSQTITNNNYDGQNCVHFLRDMDECSTNDPNYGVQNQNALRKAWKSWTGVTVD